MEAKQAAKHLEPTSQTTTGFETYKTPPFLAMLGIRADELTARHPMGRGQAEEDDIFFMFWRSIGEMSFILLPFPDALIWTSSMSKTFSPRELTAFTKFHKHAVVQKVLYRRGQGKRYCAKNHFVDFAPYFAKEYPDAKFVAVVRELRPSFCSWISLHCCVTRDLMGIRTDSPENIAAHVTCLRHFYQEMVKFFGDGKGEHMVFYFDDLVKDSALLVCQMYQKWGIPYTSQSVRAIIEKFGKDDEGHVGGARKYKNVTLEELGVTDKQLREEVNCPYLK
eukprot:CAMPEP_0196585150 /NCGR_PEP_ID=MMETSP1081-20130531/49674_1 /TAXON_ID=36882 /ORGANISM="Pyramimonas amylifera, Strain CCMP720" /LENGTH=278 /DNA_ID=CAMNT_0041906607 /DNA_START=528 /DNA_END=1364 /DNA_ORIENTATION=+